MSLITTRELCAKVGVTRQQVSVWVKEGMPKVSHGKFDRDVVLPWIADRREDTGIADIPKTVNLAESRRKLYEAQTLAVDLRNRAMQADLLMRDRVMTAGRAFASIVGQQCEEWIAEARNAEQQKERRDFANRLRTRVQHGLEHYAATLSDGEHITPARLRFPG